MEQSDWDRMLDEMEGMAREVEQLLVRLVREAGYGMPGKRERHEFREALSLYLARAGMEKVRLATASRCAKKARRGWE